MRVSTETLRGLVGSARTSVRWWMWRLGHRLLGWTPRKYDGTGQISAREFWERHGRTYREESLSHPEVRERNQRQLALLIEYLRPRPGARVLEVGCGYGQHLAELSDTLPQISLIGLDLSGSMVVSARAHLAGRPVRLIQADAARLPFRDAAFDAVLTTGSVSFIHPRHAGAVFDELLRVTRERIYHFERYRRHLKERIHQESFDLSNVSFPHDYEAEYERRGQRIVESSLFPFYTRESLKVLPMSTIIVERVRSGSDGRGRRP